eukprot:TRINITY_DN7833_c0_g1_i1.p1 TRINITY_DN7833_c0_g1~~TRINITY_DN7833_c0_g1_i1.p1  ORF type:complete len:379 (+),score=87.45 TRINITY_DN7833_c0_g1_i1:36-1172(+)
MQVYARTLDGAMWPVEVDQFMSMGDLKEEVMKVTGVPRMVQQLTVSGCSIGDDEGVGVSSVGVSADEVLDVGLTNQGAAKLALLDMGVTMDGDTLVRAAIMGERWVVRSLLEAGVSPDHQHQYGKETALTGACLKGHYDIAMSLLEKGANPNLADSFEQTPLHCTAKGAIDAGIASMLLTYGASANKKNQKGMTPLMLAIAEGRYSVVEKLLAATNLSAHDKRGLTALMYAAASNLAEIHKYIEPLIQLGSPINAVDTMGQTALFHCVNKPEVQDILVKHGSDLYVNDICNRSLYYLAAARGDTGLVKLLLRHSVPVMQSPQRTPLEGSPLIVSLSSRNFEAARLLAPHCDPHATNEEGKTAFEFCSKQDALFLGLKP